MDRSFRTRCEDEKRQPVQALTAWAHATGGDLPKPRKDGKGGGQSREWNVALSWREGATRAGIRTQSAAEWPTLKVASRAIKERGPDWPSRKKSPERS